MTDHLFSPVSPVLAHAPRLSAGAVEVDVNFTLVLIQFAVIATLVFVLKPMLFDPLLGLFEEREKRVEGARAEARKMDDEAAEILLKYEAEIQKVHKVASDERDKIRAEAQRVEAKELAEARAESATLLEAGRKKLAEERVALETQLRATEKDLARDIAGRVLGRELS